MTVTTNDTLTLYVASMRITELQKELEEERVAEANLRDILNNIKAKNSALAAHIRHLEDAGDAVCGDAIDITPRVVRWHQTVAEKPNTARLDRLKMEWQAEALDDFAADMMLDANARTARARAKKLRQQAKGDEQ